MYGHTAVVLNLVVTSPGSPARMPGKENYHIPILILRTARPRRPPDRRACVLNLVCAAAGRCSIADPVGITIDRYGAAAAASAIAA
eukprot:SAG31_NODE_1578_length_7835_cov_6.998449_7_plen_85_part_01